MLCSEWDGCQPDILVLGKALSGGALPVSAVLANDDVGAAPLVLRFACLLRLVKARPVPAARQMARAVPAPLLSLSLLCTMRLSEAHSSVRRASLLPLPSCVIPDHADHRPRPARLHLRRQPRGGTCRHCRTRGGRVGNTLHRSFRCRSCRRGNSCCTPACLSPCAQAGVPTDQDALLTE